MAKKLGIHNIAEVYEFNQEDEYEEPFLEENLDNISVFRFPSKKFADRTTCLEFVANCFEDDTEAAMIGNVHCGGRNENLEPWKHLFVCENPEEAKVHPKSLYHEFYCKKCNKCNETIKFLEYFYTGKDD